MPLIDKISADAQEAAPAPQSIAEHIEDIRYRMWEWYRLHKHEPVLAVFGITIVSWGHKAIRAAWTTVWGDPPADIARRL